MDTKDNICGCKGIRTCLICEKNKGVKISSCEERCKTIPYTFCPNCNLCWPEDQDNKVPFYLGNIFLSSDFINEEEESFLVSAIDQIPWVLSQSGRRKQDFGPKANFKKKKVKIGDFKGFPIFVKNIIERMHSIQELASFIPVELCHLEYTPERGSCIEPHVDDLWLWGDRLVTINLLSSTVLTLTPTASNSCLNSSKSSSCSSTKLFTVDKLTKGVFNNQCEHISRGDWNNFNPNVLDFCSFYNTETTQNVTAVIKITLPPRSLFVLSGCARCNWFHEIKRADVNSRRLAMTFRELPDGFLSENLQNKEFIDKILLLSKNFYNLSIC